MRSEGKTLKIWLMSAIVLLVGMVQGAIAAQAAADAVAADKVKEQLRSEIVGKTAFPRTAVSACLRLRTIKIAAPMLTIRTTIIMYFFMLCKVSKVIKFYISSWTSCGISWNFFVAINCQFLPKLFI